MIKKFDSMFDAGEIKNNVSFSASILPHNFNSGSFSVAISS